MPGDDAEQGQRFDKRRSGSASHEYLDEKSCDQILQRLIERDAEDLRRLAES